MDFSQAIEYLYNRLPVFHNIGARAYKPGLSTTRAICEHLGNPQNRYKTIHIAGTNGKGSTSHMLAAVLQKAGYKTGLYTSPHLKSFTERIRVNGVPAEETYIAEFVSSHRSFIESVSPSFFEITVAMAFDYFARENVDVAVIEVGLGGRLDSTNIITPELSVITNISFDHVKQLGDTLPKIAAEKAGIIKERVPVVIGENHGPEVDEVFISRSQSVNAPVVFAAAEWQVRDHWIENGKMGVSITDADQNEVFTGLELELTGFYQCKNILGVLSALKILKNSGWLLSEKAIYDGLSATSSITGLKGRWQVLNARPFMVCDTAHNPSGLANTIAQFMSIPAAKRTFILGFVGDKDVTAILKLLPSDASYYFCQPGNMRALPAELLAKQAQEAGITGIVERDVNKAMTLAMASASAEEAIYVGGSTFVVADIENL